MGAGLLQIGLAGAAGAAEVLPGGALDVTISGFARFLATGGDLDAQRNNDPTRGLDFRNDTEVHVIVRGKHDATGMEYGGTVEFEADTNRTDNTDETWLFVRGGFGEARFGDEDGAVDNSAIGAYTIAAATGGIDGTVVDVLAVSPVRPTNSNDATKIRYYTPSFGGFSLGVSYTPTQARRPTAAAQRPARQQGRRAGDDWVEGAAVYKGTFGGVGLPASLVGSIADIKDETALDGDNGGPGTVAPPSTCSASSSPAASATRSSAGSRRPTTMPVPPPSSARPGSRSITARSSTRKATPPTSPTTSSLAPMSGRCPA